ncbi:hypothetical protein HSBAA_37990 [Vreelandella sulfidaeris]|uniref:RlpA-like protein double-psi beta-barrel domain-containing protein n=1 Tax=Vreelandella sulfidaeris TaxID=115553 RepID=A0A455UB38_9GAMM|nr:hypothetical protein HSBAA_37990 [Halomonas sulfidaeris]
MIVRVNDRGPFHSDREIDLSYAAAARLGFLDNGTGSVKVEAMNPEQWLAERGKGGNDTVQASVPERAPEASSDAPMLLPHLLGKRRIRKRLLHNHRSRPTRIR